MGVTDGRRDSFARRALKFEPADKIGAHSPSKANYASATSQDFTGCGASPKKHDYDQLGAMKKHFREASTSKERVFGQHSRPTEPSTY